MTLPCLVTQIETPGLSRPSTILRAKRSTSAQRPGAAAVAAFFGAAAAAGASAAAPSADSRARRSKAMELPSDYTCSITRRGPAVEGGASVLWLGFEGPDAWEFK